MANTQYHKLYVKDVTGNTETFFIRLINESPMMYEEKSKQLLPALHVYDMECMQSIVLTQNVVNIKIAGKDGIPHRYEKHKSESRFVDSN